MGYAEALTKPDRPTATDQFTILIWTEEMKEYCKKLRNRKKNEEKAFPLLLGQCSPTIVQQIEASPRWSNVSGANDVLGLLELIREAMYTAPPDAKTPPHSLKPQPNCLHFVNLMGCHYMIISRPLRDWSNI